MIEDDMLRLRELATGVRDKDGVELTEYMTEIEELRNRIGKRLGGLVVLVCTECGFISGSEMEFEEHSFSSDNPDCTGVHYE